LNLHVIINSLLNLAFHFINIFLIWVYVYALILTFQDHPWTTLFIAAISIIVLIVMVRRKRARDIKK